MQDIGEVSDAQLVTSIARYSEVALAEVYRRHGGAVYGLARRVLNSTAEAEDVAQDVFLRLWNEPDRFDPTRGTLRSFLLAQSHARAVDSVRSLNARRLREAKDAQRTGVIMDLGVHVLDFYQYLLQPKWEYESAIHDGFNGPEGLAEIRLKANDAPVSIRLSRYQKQENTAHLYFEKAHVRIVIFEENVYSVIRNSDGGARRFVVESPRVDSAFLSGRVLGNFLAAAAGIEKATCEATSSLPVIDILDKIYRCAKQYPGTLGAV